MDNLGCAIGAVFHSSSHLSPLGIARDVAPRHIRFCWNSLGKSVVQYRLCITSLFALIDDEIPALRKI